jgi:hypothetical protein
MLPRHFLLLAWAGALAGCAAAPRAPAASLAAAGVAATGSFSAQVRDVATQLDAADASDAFAATWQYCANPNLPCAPQVPPAAVSERRHQLANVVALRGRAIDALGTAYAALQAEAAYDGGADLGGAADAAVASVNSFATAAGKLAGGPGGALLSEPIAGLIGFGAGLVGEHRQRRRILAASRVIAAATRRLRDGMAQEARVFDTLADYLVGKRTAARVALFQARLIAGSDVAAPLAHQLNVTLAPEAESIISSSPQVRASLQATMAAMSRAEVIGVQGRARAALAALDALIESHARLEAKQPVSVADVQRLLDRLDASFDRQPAKP